jgi:hypothetical protein
MKENELDQDAQLEKRTFAAGVTNVGFENTKQLRAVRSVAKMSI